MQRGGKDETMEIMTFIRSNRGYSTYKILKQSGMTQPQGVGGAQGVIQSVVQSPIQGQPKLL
jgi:hypothetical protein